MTKHTTSRSDITLPLLIDYVDALLPSLATQANMPIISKQANDNNTLLWVVQDKRTCLALQSQLKNHILKKDDVTVAEAEKLQISTLSELMQQQTSERYELACFWLPTLSLELLQQYIPLLMRYRDLYAAHLLLALDSTIDLKAYGFTPFNILNDQSLEFDHSDPTKSAISSATLWQFNLYDYKQLPNWLNADYWANPENWDKRRW